MDVHTKPADSLEPYQTGEVLGRGAFGVVKKAFNLQTGETVALKQIAVEKLSAEQLKETTYEIDLLRNLEHPSIVKYQGFIRTTDHLYIILEYCENGSLTTLLKKFGRFPEHLVAKYVHQVLKGLCYLHEQGVVHRDIKGSNILATKKGTVKLADFGVAARQTNAQSDDGSVVGSTYWMAPEVIEHSIVSTASDIWSLGALVIELFTGEPPFYKLEPYPALFRIVNEDCPPLPESLSHLGKDFLLQCFQKDYNLRVSAEKLLKHPWMLGIDDRVTGIDTELVLSSAHTPSPPPAQKKNSSPANEIKEIEEWNRVIHQDRKEQAKSAVPHHVSHAENPTAAAPKALPVSVLKSPNLAQQQDSQIRHKYSESRIASSENPVVLLESQKPVGLGIVGGDPVQESRPASWLNDFELDTPALDPNYLVKKGLVSNAAELTPKYLSSFIDDATHQQPRVQPKKATRKPLQLSQYQDQQDDSFEGLDISEFNSKVVLNRGALSHANASLQTKSPLSLSPAMQDASLLFEDEADSTYIADFGDELDAGAFSDEGMAAKALRDRVARDCDDVNARLHHLEGQFAEGRRSLISEKRVRTEVSALYELLVAYTDETKAFFVKNHGLLLVIELLPMTKSAALHLQLLKLLNLIVSWSPESLETMGLVGACPVVLPFVSRDYPVDVRKEACYFVWRLCQTSLLTVQMFISCRGLKTLVEMVSVHLFDHKVLALSVDAITRILNLEGPTPRNDYCRIFAREGLMEPLTYALDSMQSGPKDYDLALSISNILLLVARSDQYIRELVGTRLVLKQIMSFLQFLWTSADAPLKLSSLLLKTMRFLTLNQNLFDALQNAGAIQTLVFILKAMFIRRKDDKLSQREYDESQSNILESLHRISRHSKSRLEEIAISSAGDAIPVLIDIVKQASTLKVYAVPLLCDFASTSDSCRRLLWHHGVLDVYVMLVSDESYGVTVLEAIHSWLSEEPRAVENTLLDTRAPDALIQAFVTSKIPFFETMLDAWPKLFKLAPRLAYRFMIHAPVLDRIRKWLSVVKVKPRVRLQLLKTIQVLLDSGKLPSGESSTMLLAAIAKLRKDSAVLVSQLAKDIITAHAFVPDTKPAGVHRARRTPLLDHNLPDNPDRSHRGAGARNLKVSRADKHALPKFDANVEGGNDHENKPQKYEHGERPQRVDRAHRISAAKPYERPGLEHHKNMARDTKNYVSEKDRVLLEAMRPRRVQNEVLRIEERHGDIEKSRRIMASMMDAHASQRKENRIPK